MLYIKHVNDGACDHCFAREDLYEVHVNNEVGLLLCRLCFNFMVKQWNNE